VIRSVRYCAPAPYFFIYSRSYLSDGVKWLRKPVCQLMCVLSVCVCVSVCQCVSVCVCVCECVCVMCQQSWCVLLFRNNLFI
jgi:hypothetical protein